MACETVVFKFQFAKRQILESLTMLDDCSFQCYFWERKIGALAASIGIAAALACGLYFSGKLNVIFAAILGVVIGIIVGNVIYVVTSESFCSNPCESYSRVYSV